MGQVWPWFTHRVFGGELDAVRVVNDPIEYCVSKATATEVFVPVGHREL